MLRRNDPLRLKILRGVVLKMLYVAAHAEPLNADEPYTMGRDVLTLTLEELDTMPSNEDLVGAVRYLDAKGYVRVRWSKDGTGGFESVTLQPTGIDLVERTTEDPAVAFSRRRG
jgi:hypothetical protein